MMGSLVVKDGAPLPANRRATFCRHPTQSHARMRYGGREIF